MITEETELTWLDSHHTLSFDELIALSGLTQSELQKLVENGALTPDHFNEARTSNSNINAWHFSSHHLISIRTLSRLKHDFELENNSLSLILVFLERIRALEAQLQHLDHQK